MKAIITVPDPCPENWDAMQPNQKGRHCDHCALTVVDFTNWELPDIAQYLKSHTGQRVCGRFLDTQLHQPFDLTIFAPKIITWHTQPLRKIAALIVVCFALATTSCNNNDVQTSGEPLINVPAGFMDDTTKTDTLIVVGDISEPLPAMKDSVVAITGADKVKKKSTRKADVGYPEPVTTMGIPELPEPPYIAPPPVAQGHKFQPPTGPPEYDSTKTEY